MKGRIVLLISLLALGLFLFGCINYEQTLKLQGTGGGVANIHYWYVTATFSPDSGLTPPASTEADVKKEYEKGGVKIANFKTETKKDKDPTSGEQVEWTHVYFDVNFDNASQFAQTTLGDAKECKWEDTKEGYVFTEKITPNTQMSGQTSYHVTYSVVMPGKVKTASDPGKIDGSKATWTWDLDSYSKLGTEFTMTCTSEKAAPVGGGMGIWLWVIIGVVVIVIIIVIIIIVVMAGKKKAPAAK
jgi:hypothetical protein